MARIPSVVPWALQWTPDHVRRYWDWWGSNPALAHLYFSRRYGDSLLDQVSRAVPLRGTMADLGCGPGYLVEKALARGLRALAVDSSPDSIKALRTRLARHPGFLGAHVSQEGRIPLDDGVADIVSIVETVEHLDDAVLDGLLAEARRIARPRGHVVVTTPNDENLPELQVMCPDCGCVFHQFQHVRSFSPAALRERMERSGLETVVCRPVLFSALPRWGRSLERMAYRLFKGRLPHLVYVGRRP